MDHRTTAASVLAGVGGADNIDTLIHCATRLRFTLKDRTLVDESAVTSVAGVLTTADAGGQFQVVIGNEVPEVFAGIESLRVQAAAVDGEGGPREDPRVVRGSLLSRFVGMISAIFTPILWALAATGLLKALLAVSVLAAWIDKESTGYAILNALSDAFIAFLPIALAVTAAEYFKAQQFTSIAIAAALVYPAITALAGREGLSFFGIPVIMVSYTSSVIPIIIAVWVQSRMEEVLYRVLPAAVRRFLTPMIVVLLLVPLVFIVVGPVSSVMSSGLSQGVSAIFTVAPWLGGALVGGLWQVLVIFGLHWTFIPLFMVEYQQSGFIYLLAPVFAAKLAQTAATAAVWWRTRDQSLRSLSAPATLSGLLAGVTEPALYGVNLPLRRPFIFGIIGGVLGGAVISAGGIASNSFALASLVSVPSLMGRGSVAMVFIGLGVAMAAAFVLTALFGVPRPRLVPPEDSVANDDGRVRVFSPLRGAIRPLADVDDPVFSRGALGPGLAVVPAEGIVRAPFAGTVVAAPVGSHALGLRAGNGAEVLIHIGLDTVKLAGEFFTRRVEVGNHVDPGQVILEFDREALLAAGYDLITPVVLTNSRRFDLFESVEGDAGHETVLFSVGRSGAPQGDSSSLPASATHLREGSA